MRRFTLGRTLTGLLLSAMLVACPRQAIPAAVRASYQSAPGLVPPCEAIKLNVDLNDSKLVGKTLSYSFQVSPVLEGSDIFQIKTSESKATWFLANSPKETTQLSFTGTATDSDSTVENIAGPVVTLAAGSGEPCGNIQGRVRDGIRFSSLNTGLSATGLNTGLSATGLNTGLSGTGLNTGNNASSQLLNVPDDAEFVPNEAIVKLKPSSLRATSLVPSAARLQFSRSIIGQTGVIHLQGTGLNRLSTSGFVTAGSATGQATLNWIRSLAARPDVEYAEPNYRATLESEPDDPLFQAKPDPQNPNVPVSSQRWHYEQLNIPAAWDLLANAPNVPAVTKDNIVTVAVIDSGILWHPNDPASRHPDFNCTVATGVTKIAPGYDMVESDDNPFDDNDASFHGSHVAGTIGACSNNAEFGAGVAWKARIQAIRAFNKGSSSFETIARSVYWAAGSAIIDKNDTGPNPRKIINPNPVQIINMSLGGPAKKSDGTDIVESQLLQEAVTDATNRGVIVVVAAGNKNLDASGFVPANLRGVIVVGATGPEKSRASYSNHGSTISVMAPGGDQARRSLAQDGVLSLGGCGGYDNFAGNAPPCADKFGSHFLQGTSMATPHVSGVIAMMLQAQPKLRNPTDKARNWARVLAYLRDSSSLTGMTSCERGCGAGLLDAAKAVQTAIDYPSMGPLLVPVPSSTNSESVNGAIVFGLEDTVKAFSIKNIGDAPAIVNITTTSPGLKAGASNVPTNGEGSVSVNLDRNGVTEGSYAGRISISYGATTGPKRLLEVRAYYSVGLARPISSSQNVRVRLYKRDITCANDQRRVNFPSLKVAADGGFNLGNLEFGTYDLIAYRIKPGTTPGPTDEVSVSELGRLDNLDFRASGTPKLLDQDITLEPTAIVIGPEDPLDHNCAPSLNR
jgi:serine protease